MPLPPSLQDRFLSVLTDTAEQVLRGKGEERHGRGRPFEEQPTFKILGLVGEGYAIIRKKSDGSPGRKRCKECERATVMI